MTSSEQELESLFVLLADPFPEELVEWQVIDLSKDKLHAFVIPFVNPRHYQDRLNAIVPGWENHIDFVLPDCQLARYRLVIQGISREGIGEDLPNDPSSFEGKINRAMIRACQAFGLGKYLLFIIGCWIEYDPKEKRILIPPSLAAWARPGGAGAPANAIGKILGEMPIRNQRPFQATTTSPMQSKTEKQPDDAIASGTALEAYGALVLKATQAGVEGSQPVVPPISVGELRKRYAEVRSLLAQAQKAGGRL